MASGERRELKLSYFLNCVIQCHFVLIQEEICLNCILNEIVSKVGLFHTDVLTGFASFKAHYNFLRHTLQMGTV